MGRKLHRICTTVCMLNVGNEQAGCETYNDSGDVVFEKDAKNLVDRQVKIVT